MFIRKLLRWIWIALPIGFGNYLYKTLTSGNPADNKIIWIIVLTLVASKFMSYAISDYYIANRARRGFLAVSMQAFCLSIIPLIGSTINLGNELIMNLIFGALGFLVLLTAIWIHRINAEEDEEEDEEEDDDYDYEDE